MPSKSGLLPLKLNLTDILTELMQGVLILATLALPIERWAPAWRFQLYPLVLAAFALTYLVRRVSRKIWQYVLFSFAIVIITLGLPLLPSLGDDLRPRLILSLALVFLVLRSFFQRLRDQPLAKPIKGLYAQPFALLFLIGLDVIAVQLGLSALSLAYFDLSIIYLVLTLVRWHRLALNRQMERFVVSPAHPTTRIFQFSTILLVGFIAGAVILLALSPSLRLDDLVPLLGQGLLALIRWLVDLATRRSAHSGPTADPTTPTAKSPLPPVGDHQTAAWLLVLQQIVNYLLITAAIILLVALIINTLYRLYRRFYDTGRPDSDQRESLLPGIADLFLERLERSRERWHQQFGQSPDQKIRRLFFRLIASQIQHGLDLQASLTGRQLVDRLNHERYPQLAEINALYEAARYGPGTCKPEDAARMQVLVRGLHRENLVLPPT
jgi:large-conductance mechanosensitive channel